MRETRGAEDRDTKLPFVMLVTVVLMVFLGCCAPVHGHFGSCEDHTPQCPRLARLGHCQTRRQLMLQNCPVSCDACVDPNCYDRSKRCSAMAQRGLCESQKAFMLKQCPHSCDACRIGLTSAVAITNLQTIINPDFECGRPLSRVSVRGKRQIVFPDELEAIRRQQQEAGTRTNPRQPGQSPQVDNEQIIPLAAPAGGGSGGDANKLGVEDTFCGATPIHEHFLLTAAHCVFDPDRPVITVRLGELDFASEGEPHSRPADYLVEQIIVHPDFDPSKLERYNDVALIQTREKIQFNELVYPFCISENAPAPGSLVTGAGFGFVNVTHRPTRLQEADLEVLEASRCEDIFRREQFLPQLRLRYPELLQGKSIFCASYPERSACQGDSGGPLYQDRGDRRFLVGIVGSGVSCRSNGISVLPGLYVDVADHIEFIDSVIYSPSRLQP